MSKAAFHRQHAKQRASERYGVSLTKEALREMVSLIQRQKFPEVKFLRKHSVRVTEWSVDWNGTRFRVLYDKHRKTIATVLPPKET